jgi:hypothetical protein
LKKRIKKNMQIRVFFPAWKGDGGYGWRGGFVVFSISSV